MDCSTLEDNTFYQEQPQFVRAMLADRQLHAEVKTIHRVLFCCCPKGRVPL